MRNDMMSQSGVVVEITSWGCEDGGAESSELGVRISLGNLTQQIRAYFTELLFTLFV